MSVHFVQDGTPEEQRRHLEWWGIRVRELIDRAMLEGILAPENKTYSAYVFNQFSNVRLLGPRFKGVPGLIFNVAIEGCAPMPPPGSLGSHDGVCPHCGNDMNDNEEWKKS